MTRYSLPLLIAVISIIASSFAQEPIEPGVVGVAFYLRPGAAQPVSLEKLLAAPKVSRSMATVDFSPERSPVRISETRPSFVAKLASAPRQDREIMLRLDTVIGKRTALMSIGPGGLTQPLPGKFVVLEYKKVGQSSYLIRPVEPLRAGEYCLSLGNSNVVFLFGIEPGATDLPTETEPDTKEVVKQKDPNNERLKILNSLLAKGLIGRADYDTRKSEILNPPPAKPVTIEDRLRKLNDLLKKGLIGQPEYEKKRTEILSEM